MELHAIEGEGGLTSLRVLLPWRRCCPGPDGREMDEETETPPGRTEGFFNPGPELVP